MGASLVSGVGAAVQAQNQAYANALANQSMDQNQYQNMLTNAYSQIWYNSLASLANYNPYPVVRNAAGETPDEWLARINAKVADYEAAGEKPMLIDALVFEEECAEWERLAPCPER